MTEKETQQALPANPASSASTSQPRTAPGGRRSRLLAYFEDYQDAHRTPGNRLCHSIGIPLITLTLLGLLGGIELRQPSSESDLLRLDGGIALLAGALLWYLRLDWKLALPFGVFSFGLYLLGRSLSSPALWTLFVVGWVLQYLGHLVFEKNQPAFYRNLKHLLIGPLWIFARWVGYQPAR
jgi:uncharacterized membrane protein YGL010W